MFISVEFIFTSLVGFLVSLKISSSLDHHTCLYFISKIFRIRLRTDVFALFDNTGYEPLA